MLKTGNPRGLLALFIMTIMLTAASPVLAGNETGVGGISHRFLNYTESAISAESLADRISVESPMLAGISAVKFTPMAGLMPISVTGTSELYVQRLAERRHSQRIREGVAAIAIGGIFVGLGVVISGDEDLSEDDKSGVTFAYIVGGVFAGVGIYSLAVPSRAEREYDNVMAVSNPVQREKAGHEVLISLADDARRDRLLSGVGYMGLAVYFVAARPYGGEESGGYYSSSTATDYGIMNDILAATYGVMAIVSFVAKSHEEKALERYSLEIADGSGFDFRFGPIRGGIGTALVYNF